MFPTNNKRNHNGKYPCYQQQTEKNKPTWMDNNTLSNIYFSESSLTHTDKFEEEKNLKE